MISTGVEPVLVELARGVGGLAVVLVAVDELDQVRPARRSCSSVKQRPG
jgi:hypothetical protein